MGNLKIKVCGMRDVENVRAVCALKPDYLGFIFVPSSKRFVGNEPEDRLFREVPKETKTVGVFVDAPVDIVRRSVEQYRLDAVQLHGHEDAAYREGLKAALSGSVCVIRAVSMEEDPDLSSLDERWVDFFLFDSGKGGTGKRFDWNKLSGYTGSLPYFIAGGIGPEEAESILTLVQSGAPIAGIDLNSAVEVSPGIKDVQRVKAVIDTVRV